MVEILHERAQCHAIIRIELTSLDLLLPRASRSWVVPVERACIYNHPVVGEEIATILVREVVLEELPIYFELGLLLLEET